jgi:hypothetical protein
MGFPFSVSSYCSIFFNGAFNSCERVILSFVLTVMRRCLLARSLANSHQLRRILVPPCTRINRAPEFFPLENDRLEKLINY